MSSSFFLLIAAVAVLAFFAGILRSMSGHTRRKGQGKSYSYGKKPYLFSRAERSFLGVLEQASEGRYRVFGKVRLADVLEPRSGMTRGGRQSALNKILSKHLDFVLCAPDDLSPVAAVELDDKSHQRPERRARDGFLEGALRTAGLPLLRFPVQASYSVHEVRASLGTLLGPPPAPGLGSKPMEPVGPPASARQEAPASLCMKCGGRLVERVGRKGANAGKSFLGCENYPKCRNVVGL